MVAEHGFPPPPQERLPERTCEQVVDVRIRLVVEQVLEVPKNSSQDRTLQRAVEQIPDVPVPEMVTQLLEVPKIVPQDRILQQTVEQVASNREASVKVFSEELKALAEATQVLQSETSGADGQTYSSFQEDSSAALRTSTDLKGFELVILVRRLAEQEHCISATMKFGAGADGDPSVKVKDLITDLISRLQAEASSEKREDLEADVAKHSSKLEAAVARSIDGEISTQQVANTHVQHVVNTVEVERPKLIKETVQEKINQVTKHIKIPQVQFLAKVDDMPVVVQRQVSTAQTVQKAMEVPQLQFTNKVNDIPVEAQRQISMVWTIQKTTEIPQLQCVNEVIDVPAVFVEQAPHVHVVEKTAEIPQMQTVEKIGETPQTQMILSARTSESSVTAPVLENSPVVVGSEQPAHVAEYMTLEPMVSEIRDLKSDLVHIRELLGVLVRKERSAEAKAEIAARRLNRMERERDQESEAECEVTLEEALADPSKVVRVIVDKWFVDRGFGFGKVPTGEIVFIHASAVVGAEVLTIGTDAWVQVVNDDARAQGGYRARRAWGQDVWQAEKDKEKANKVAQQVRRAAALTAELAAQSEKKTAAVCDQPPGLDELVGHIEAPNMGAGGSHPQATMMPDPWATFKSPSASQATVISPLPAGQSFSNFSGKSRKGRPRSSTRAQDNTAVLEETLRLFVEATDKDEASMRQQLVNKRPTELLRSREFWRTRVEEKQRFQAKKKEAWEFFRRMPSFKPKSQEEFEEEFRRRVMTGYFSGSNEGREKYLVEWIVELQKKALEGDRKLEARERMKMGQEDSNSKRRTEWERIFERSPFLKAAS